MQTFLPFPDFAQSARSLDRARLGKQRIEALQLVRGALGQTGGWNNHPAAKMWQGHTPALIQYGLAICDEWMDRGYRDTVSLELTGYKVLRFNNFVNVEIVNPRWLGDERFHRSHRSNLLRKDEKFYRAQGWLEPITLPYFWPTQHRDYAPPGETPAPPINVQFDSTPVHWTP